MRKEVFYSLAALGMAPVVADAAVVNTIPTDASAWQKSATSTSVAVNAQTGVITVSTGGEVTQELATSLVPGVYTLKFKTNSGDLAVKVLGKAANATSFTTLEEDTLQTQNDAITFKVTETSTISISVNKATAYNFGGAELKLNYDFKEAADAMADTLASFKDNIKAYKTDPAEGYDAQIIELEAQIAAILALETLQDATDNNTGFVTHADSVRFSKYQEFKLYNDIEEIGEDPSDIMAAILALRQNAFVAEKAALEEELAAADEILGDDDLYEGIVDEATTTLRNEIAAAIAGLEPGDATTDIQSDLETLAGKLQKIQTASANVTTAWNNIKTNLEALVPKYSSLADWSADNLNENADFAIEGSKNLTQKNKYAGLAAHLAREIQHDRDTLLGSGTKGNYKLKIEQAYAAGTLFVVKDDGTIDDTKGLWKDYKPVYDKLIEALGAQALPLNSVSNNKSYEYVYGTNFKALVDAAYDKFEPYMKAYAKALADGDGIADVAPATAIAAAKAAMTKGFREADSVYQEAVSGVKYGTAYSNVPANKWVKTTRPDHFSFGTTLTTFNTGTPAKYTDLGLRTDETVEANMKLIDKYYKACGDKIKHTEKYNTIKDSLEAAKVMFENLINAWADSAGVKNSDAVKKYKLDAKAPWLSTDTNVKYTKGWFNAKIDEQLAAIARVKTRDLYTAATAKAADKNAFDHASDSLAAITGFKYDGTTANNPNGDYTIREVIDSTHTGTPAVINYSGIVVTSFNALNANIEKWALQDKRFAAVDSLLRLDTAGKDGNADADNAHSANRFNLAYEDADGIAFASSKILPASYGNQMAGIKGSLDLLKDSLLTQSKTLPGQKFVDLMTKITAYTTWDGASTAILPNKNFPYQKIKSFIDGFYGSADPMPEQNVAIILANSHDTLSAAGYVHPLVSNKLYMQLKDKNQADIATTIKNIEAKEALIIEGVQELIKTKDQNGNYTDDNISETTTPKASELYGPGAAELIANIDALDATVGAMGDLGETSKILTDAALTTIENEAQIDASATNGEIHWDTQELDANANPSSANINAYTAHLDDVLAQLKVYQSEALAAAQNAAAEAEFYETTDETLLINGNAVSPKDVVDDLNALTKYYNSIKTPIERNTFRQYPGLATGATFADTYKGKKDSINGDGNNNPQIAAGTVTITKLKDAITAAKTAGNLKTNWEKEGGFHDQIVALTAKIGNLKVWADAAQGLYDSYQNVADYMADANLIKDKGNDPWVDPTPSNVDNSTLLWNEVKNQIDALTNYDTAAGAEAEAHYIGADGVLMSLKNGFFKENSNPKALVQKLDSIFEKAKTELNKVTSDGTIEGDGINETEFKNNIDDTKTLLLSLVDSANVNNVRYAKQKLYAKGNVEEEVKPIETHYYEVYTAIMATPQTSKKQTYVDQLVALKAGLDKLKDSYSEADGWDQLVVKYKAGKATQSCADSLENIYNEISQIALTQEEEFDSIVALDNEALHQQVLASIANAEAAYNKAVEIQESFTAQSKILASALDTIAAQRLAYNAELKNQRDKLFNRKDTYNGIETVKDSYANWCKNHVGQSYKTQANADSAKFHVITDSINQAVSGIMTDIAKVKEVAALRALCLFAKDTLASMNGNLYTSALAFKLENTDAATALIKEKVEDVQTGFGAILKDDKGKETGRTGYLEKAKAVADAYSKTGAEFSLKALDEALVALPNNFVENSWHRFNDLSKAILEPLVTEAERAYAKGNELYGPDSDASEAEKKAWASTDPNKKNAAYYTNSNKNGVMDQYLAADAADTLAVNDHNNQLGKKFATIKQLLEDFLENNLYSKNHNDSVKAAKAAAQADSLMAKLAKQESIISQYGAAGSMQATIMGIEDEINDLLNMKNGAKDSATIDAEIFALAPQALANYEAQYIQEQIDALKEQYNKLEAAGDENAAAAKDAIADLNAALKVQNDRINLYKNVPAKPALPKKGATEKDDAFQARMKTYNETLAERTSKLAHLQAACDSLLAMEGMAADSLAKYAGLAGTTDAAVAADLALAIEAANDAATAVAQAIDADEDLSDEQKAALKEELKRGTDILDEAEEALTAALEASEDEPGAVIVNQNAIQQLIDAAEAQITAAKNAAENAAGELVASNDAADKMLNNTTAYTVGEGDNVVTYFSYSVKMLEDQIKAIKEAIADQSDNAKYKHLTESDYKASLDKIEGDIAALKAEVEKAKEDLVADKYMKTEDGEFIFKKKGDKINTAIGSFKDLIAQQEMVNYIAALNELVNDIDDALVPAKFTNADYTDLTAALKGQKELIFKDAFIDANDQLVEASGLAVDVQNGVVDHSTTNLKRDFQTLVGRAQLIEAALKSLAEVVDAKSIIVDPDVPEPGDIAGDIDGDGFVTSDDVEQFLDDLLYGNLPEEGDDEFDIYDVNGDGLINIADAQGIQNLSLGLNVDGSVPSDEAAARRSETPAGNVTAETTQLQNGAQRITLTLSGNFDWTGFQMDVKGAEVLSETASLSLKSADKNGTHRIVAFGAAQGNGQVITLDVQGNAQLGTITFTTANAQAVSFKLSGTTGIYGITTESASTSYDLSGKIVKGMKKGVNIIRDAAGKVKKAIMK